MKTLKDKLYAVAMTLNIVQKNHNTVKLKIHVHATYNLTKTVKVNCLFFFKLLSISSMEMLITCSANSNVYDFVALFTCVLIPLSELAVCFFFYGPIIRELSLCGPVKKVTEMNFSE